MAGAFRLLRFAAWGALLALGTACASLPPPPPARQDGYRYVDARLGIALELPPGWRGFTSRSELPPEMRDAIPRGFGPKPAMVGVEEHGAAFVRVLTEPVLGMSTLEYFEALRGAVQGEAELLGAAYAPEQDAVRWRFRGGQGALSFTFVETLTVRRSHAIRIAFWTVDGLASAYADEFASIEAGTLLHDGTGWGAPWQDLEASLDPAYFGELELAAPADVAPIPVCSETRRGALWRVRGERGETFLFPSLHAGHPDQYPLPAPVEKAFADADRLVVELDVRRPDAAALVAGAAGRAGTRVELTPWQKEEAERRLAAYGLPLSQFADSPPWLVAATLELLGWQTLGYLPQFGVDLYFLERAGEREVVELETAAEQVETLERIGGLGLDYTLRTFDSLPEGIRTTYAAWYCGDDTSLTEFASKLGAEMPAELQEAMLASRNETMVERLEPLLDEPGVTFVTVGLGHFVGPRGIPALLEQRGYGVLRHGGRLGSGNHLSADAALPAADDPR